MLVNAKKIITSPNIWYNAIANLLRNTLYT